MKIVRNVVVSAVLLVVAVKMLDTGNLFHFGGEVGNSGGIGRGAGSDVGGSAGSGVGGSAGSGIGVSAASGIGGSAASGIGGSGGGVGGGVGANVGVGVGGGAGGGAGAGVTVPGMNSGYPCELGELGKPAVYDNKKEFWGDDSISQGLKRASDAVGNSTRESIRDSARKLGVSL